MHFVLFEMSAEIELRASWSRPEPELRTNTSQPSTTLHCTACLARPGTKFDLSPMSSNRNLPQFAAWYESISDFQNVLDINI